MIPDDHYLKLELYSLIKTDSSIFEFLQAGSLDGIWYWDLENPEQEWLSPRFWEILGYNPEEKKHLASEWQDIIFQEDLEVALDNFHKHCEDPKFPYDQIVRYLHQDGSTVWIRCRGIVIRDASGKPIRMLGAHTNITQIKKAEEELRISEELHRITVQNIMDLVLVTDDVGNFTYICANVEYLLGYGEDEIRGMGNIAALLGDNLFYLRDLVISGSIYNMEWELTTKDGLARNYLINVKKVSIGDGTILYVCRDITDFKKLNDQYIQSERLYRDLVETSQDLIWQCDLEGRYTYLNPAWENTFGYKLSEMLGMPFSFFQSAENAKKDEKEFRRLLQVGEVKGYESEHIAKDGQPIYLVFNARTVKDDEGMVVGTRGTAHDITQRYKTQLQLRQSNESYQNLFEHMLDGFALHEILCDSSGQPVDYRFLKVNPAFEKLTGLKAENLEGQRVLKVLPATEKHWIETYGRVALTGEPVSFENYSQELDKYFTVKAYRPAKNQFACIFQDVTPKRKSEIKLREALQLNQMIIETSPVGLLIFKESGPCVMTNPEASNIAKASQEELSRLNFREMESYRKTGILEDMEKVLVTGEMIRREVHVENTFGADVWFDGYISSFTLEGEKHILFLFQDIWDRKRLESKLLKQHAEFQAIFNSITDAIVFVDEKRHIIRVNPAFETIMGYTQEEVIGKTTEFFYANPDEYLTQGKVRYNKKTENSQNVYEMDYRRKDGSVFPSETLGVPVRNSQDETVGFLGVMRDISERKESERERDILKKQWQQSQKLEAIGTLAGGIAHDFNNILGVIIGYSELASIGGVSNEAQIKNHLELVTKAALRAKDLVQQILAFSRQSHTERFIMKPQIVVKEALKLLRASIPSTIEIQEEIDHGCGSINANPTQLNQIVMNLCTNAFHAMEKEGGILKVGLNPIMDVPPGVENDKVDYVELSVSDTGQGMDSELIHKIFDPFFTTKEAGKGTGMGLSIVYGIIKEYGGNITVDSTPGKGTTFHVYLPLVEGDENPVEKGSPNLLKGNERILLVDDEELLIELNKEILGKLGYKVTAKTNGFEAIETFKKQPKKFDLLITDQTMPGMTGLKLAKEILQIRPDIPVFLCTGYSHLVDEALAKAQGIKEFALKPLTQESLSVLVRKVLDKG